MKKLVSVICSLVLLSSSLFAKNFFSQRYFEIGLNAPVSVSNNAFGLTDLMKKELVIDFTKISKELPRSGFNIIADSNPDVVINLNLPLFNLGFETGVEVFGKVGVGKGIFDFLGKGYELGQKLNVSLDFDADVFVSAGVKAGFNIGFFSVEVNPSVFLPIIHVAPENAYVELENDENGDISLDAKARLNAYSIVNLTGYNMNALAGIPSEIGNSMGFDVAGSVHFKYFDNLDLWGTARIPFVPGHLKYAASVGASAEYKGNVGDLISSIGSQDKGEKDNPVSAASDDTTETEKKGFEWQMDDFSKISFVKAEKAYYIHRPMKLDVYANFALIPNFLEFTSGLGIGIRNPFAKNQKEVEFYPEYYLASQVGLANIIVIKASSEYMDQLFKHQLALKLNIRFAEVNVGASLQSGSFVSSLKLAGAGAFVNVFIGF